MIREAVEHHGYTQKAVADHFHLHYSTVNRILAKLGSHEEQE
ncbi:helix-turn-helix domain-containing protein [Geomonas oryzae]